MRYCSSAADAGRRLVGWRSVLSNPSALRRSSSATNGLIESSRPGDERIGPAVQGDRVPRAWDKALRPSGPGLPIERYASEMLVAWKLSRSIAARMLLSCPRKRLGASARPAVGHAHDGARSEVMDWLILPAFRAGDSPRIWTAAGFTMGAGWRCRRRRPCGDPGGARGCSRRRSSRSVEWT